jgi:hypothetical protein
MMMMIRGIKSSLVKSILDQINFAYLVSISFVAFEIVIHWHFWELINH